MENVDSGIVRVWNKGKYRLVVLPEKLCDKLKQYIRDQKLQSGMVFITRNGKAVDRSNIWREMKRLSERAEIPKETVFPHNLRHLFGKKLFSSYKKSGFAGRYSGHSSMEVTRIYASDGNRILEGED